MATKKKTEPVNPWDEEVEIMLHKDTRNSGDQFVGVNGRSFQIKRGVRVKVPRPVYEVLMNSMEADALTAEAVAEAGEASKEIL